MITVHQMKTDGCCSYVVGFPNKEALVIDPSGDIEKIKNMLDQDQLKATLIIDTHTHADHISKAPELSEALAVPIAMSSRVEEQRSYSSQAGDAIKAILEKNSSYKVSKLLHENEIARVGDVEVRFIATPGHTKDAMCIVVDNKVFTGDTLFIGQVGRADFPGSDAGELYDSITTKLLPLGEDMIIYPGHEYNENVNSSLGYEKTNNPFLKVKSKEEFVNKVNEAFKEVKPGMHCGAAQSDAQVSFKELMMTTMVKAFMQNPPNDQVIRVETLKEELDAGKNVVVLDVRNPEEVAAGKIPGAVTIPLPELANRVNELPDDLYTEIVTTCKMGGRAATALLFLKQVKGYKNIRNLVGATDAWKAAGYATE